MLRSLLIFSLWFVLAPLSFASAEEGGPAPDFKLQGSDGKEYSLAEFRGETPVVLAWFPKAFTGG